MNKSNQFEEISFPQYISLKTLAEQLDTHRSTVRRWLEAAGIKAVIFGNGKNGSIRYDQKEVIEWIKTRETI